MENILELTPSDRRSAWQKAAEQLRFEAMSIEKDFWVCWTLRDLFALPEIGPHLTFKGGTSLSKAWGLIQRFSEDIDVVVDKHPLGFGGDASPDRARSKKQRKAQIERLMEASRRWVQEVLQPALTMRINSTLGRFDWKLEVDPEMADGQCLLFHYPSSFCPDEAGYIRPVVKIELGARSDDWPSAERSIRPYVTDAIPQLISGTILVRALVSERTFWEKACLLHEETFRPADKPRKLRMARHYYDLWCLIRAGVGERAMAATELFTRVAEHREIFFRYSWVDYTTHRPGAFRLAPREHQVDEWRKDYNAMLGPMFFGDVPTFDEVLDVVRAFEESFNGNKGVEP
jgi:predicted nucleotidyltransferase component of viral defense system